MIGIQPKAPKTASFLVRLWRDPDGPQGWSATWLGEVQHVQSAKVVRFRGVDQIAGALRELLGVPGETEDDTE